MTVARPAVSIISSQASSDCFTRKPAQWLRQLRRVPIWQARPTTPTSIKPWWRCSSSVTASIVKVEINRNLLSQHRQSKRINLRNLRQIARPTLERIPCMRKNLKIKSCYCRLHQKPKSLSQVSKSNLSLINTLEYIWQNLPFCNLILYPLSVYTLIWFFCKTGQLYFCCSANSIPSALLQQDCHIVNIDHEFEYEGYNTDFGPLTLNFVHKFITRIDSMLLNNNNNNYGNGERKRVVHQCSQSYKHQANASFLIGAYLIVSHNWPLVEVKEALGTAYL